ncbi:hypothetical protein J3A83DRAFT_4189978 [Scleroderma citrinum]
MHILMGHADTLTLIPDLNLSIHLLDGMAWIVLVAKLACGGVFETQHATRTQRLRMYGDIRATSVGFPDQEPGARSQANNLMAAAKLQANGLGFSAFSSSLVITAAPCVVGSSIIGSFDQNNVTEWVSFGGEVGRMMA